MSRYQWWTLRFRSLYLQHPPSYWLWQTSPRSTCLFIAPGQISRGDMSTQTIEIWMKASHIKASQIGFAVTCDRTSYAQLSLIVRRRFHCISSADHTLRVVCGVFVTQCLLIWLNTPGQMYHGIVSCDDASEVKWSDVSLSTEISVLRSLILTELSIPLVVCLSLIMTKLRLTNCFWYFRPVLKMSWLM